jgi:hypothetical protein
MGWDWSEGMKWHFRCDKCEWEGLRRSLKRCPDCRSTVTRGTEAQLIIAQNVVIEELVRINDKLKHERDRAVKKLNDYKWEESQREYRWNSKTYNWANAMRVRFLELLETEESPVVQGWHTYENRTKVITCLVRIANEVMKETKKEKTDE